MKKIDDSFSVLMDDIRQLINRSRQYVAQVVNNELPLLYWHIGTRIKSDVLNNKRAEYGKRVIKDVAEKLTLEYGSGWSAKHLLHCLRIAETISKESRVLYKIPDSVRKEV